MSSNSSAPASIAMVYLVDDEKVVRAALAWLLRSRRLLSQSFDSAESFEAALDEPAVASPEHWPAGPSCMLLDLRMGGMSGLSLFDRLAQRGLTQAMPVIFLTGHGDVATAVSAIKRGAFDFVEKPFSDNALVDRVESALAASRLWLDARADREHQVRTLQQLSEREGAVMELISRGLPNKLIADNLSLSIRTVEIHRARVFEKLGVNSAVELVNVLHALRTPP
jgi:two-component system response regulator DctR